MLLVVLSLCAVGALAQSGPKAEIIKCSWDGNDCTGSETAVVVPRNARTTVVCKATKEGEGEELLRVRWQAEGAKGVLVLSESAESEIMPVVTETVTYICTAVDNSGNEHSKSITFQVLPSPLEVELTECRVDEKKDCEDTNGVTEVEMDSVVRMVCRSSGGKPPVRVSWMVEGVRPLGASKNGPDGIDEITMKILTRMVLICTATDSEGETATLRKTLAPVTPEEPFISINVINPILPARGRLELTTGDTVTLVCEGVGNPRHPENLELVEEVVVNGAEVDEPVEQQQLTKTVAYVKIRAEWTVKEGKQTIACRGSNGHPVGMVTSRVSFYGVP